MNRKEYADFLLPNVEHDFEYYNKLYPKRDLKEGSIVTRFAPSPTGFVHIGSLFTAFVASKLARQTDGVVFLRIEDTDQERSVENGVTDIITDLKNFNINFDEGMINETEEKGSYGPYTQSNRKDIYQAFAKYLIEQDLAYPCFCTKEELESIRKEQEAIKARIGYYGKWAKYRNITSDEAKQRIDNGEEYIIRLKSPGDFDNKVIIDDLVRGRLEFPENDMDIVIIKKDGLPTYHFAHLVDDYLMHTTHVVRSDEWLSSLPVHVQLFQVFGFKTPKYVHLSPLMKKDNGIVRKISKRKDAEAAVSFYHEQGIPSEAVMLYIMTVANSNFEAWLDQNPDGSIDDFKIEYKKISSSGSLFDMDKLLNISKNYISRLKADDIYNRALNYTEEYDSELYELLVKYKDYSISFLNIERDQKKPRKDLAKFSDIRNEIWYMYDELFNVDLNNYEYQNITDLSEIKLILETYINEFYDVSDKETWFNKIKELSSKLGYASEVKEYKNNPDNYKGHVGDVSTVLRVSLTSKSKTPDLYEIMKNMGKEKIQTRFDIVLKNIL